MSPRHAPSTTSIQLFVPAPRTTYAVDIAAHLSHARLENVLRTNTMTALNDGAKDEAISLGASVALMRYDAIRDPRTRKTHLAMDGFVESPSHPIWNTILPPDGFQCRCSTSVIGWASAERLGLAKDGHLLQGSIDKRNAPKWELINTGKFPDPSFK